MNFYFTFGQKYEYVPHPTYPMAHPSKWVRIIANSWEEAVKYAHDLFDGRYATSYNDKTWDASYFPGGEIEVIDISKPQQP